MRIQPIILCKPMKNNFKKNDEIMFSDYENDNYYKNITIKDAFISAGIVSGLCYIGTGVLAYKEEIKNFINKGKKTILNKIRFK